MSEDHMSESSPNILLVVLDSVRADRIHQPASFELEIPVLNQLRTEAHYHRGAYTTGSWTVPAHGSLFTGKLPRQHGAHARHKYLDVEHPNTIAGLLSAAGYTSIGVSPNPWITPEFGFATGFDEFLTLKPSLPFTTPEADPRDLTDNANLSEILRWVISGNPFKRLTNGLYEKIINKSPYTSAEEVTNRVLNQATSVDEPWFVFVNYMDAHEPYGLQQDHLPSELDLDDSALDFDWNLHCYENPPAPGTRGSIERFYDASLSYLDKQLGELLSGINLETTLLIIVSDHGQSLGESNYWGHGTHLSAPLIDVPLIIRTPESSNLDYNGDAIIDLSDIPDIIRESVGIGGESFSWKSNFEIEIDAAVAESFGPHQRVDNLPKHISNAGYRVVCTADLCLNRNLDNDKIECLEGNLSVGQKSHAINLERIITKQIPVAHGAETDRISSVTQARLEELGYI